MRSDLSIDRPIENPLALATGQFHNERQKAIPVKNLGRGARLALERKGTVPYALEIIAQRAVQFDWNPNTAHALTCVLDGFTPNRLRSNWTPFIASTN